MNNNNINSKKIISIPTGLQILLADLDFIGQICRGQKACVTNRVLVDGESWSGALYRSWKGENRINTISKIEQIVNQTVDAIDDHKDTEYIGIIINSFNYARNGVASLVETYQNDPDMKARLNVQLKNIDLQLDQYRNLIKGYSERKTDNNAIEEKKDEKEDDVEINLNPEFFGNTSSEKRKLRRHRMKKSTDKQS